MKDDLFGGNPVIPDGPAMTPAERRKTLGIKPRPVTPNGYYMPPGTGPAGETCRTCRFAVARRFSKTYWKCRLHPQWTGGPGTDIRLKSPACQGWEAKEVK